MRKYPLNIISKAIPSIFTTGNFLCGLYAIISLIKGSLNHFAIAILVGVIFDTMDGWVAKLMNTNSKIGPIYDSIADALTFGIAPGLFLTHLVSTYPRLTNLIEDLPLNILVWIIAVIFTVASTQREFIKHKKLKLKESTEGDYFLGLPNTVSAGVLASAFIWLEGSFLPEVTKFSIILIISCSLVYLMRSNFYYLKPKQINIKEKVPLSFVLYICLVFFALWKFTLAIFLFFIAYALSGPLKKVFSALILTDHQISVIHDLEQKLGGSTYRLYNSVRHYWKRKPK